MLLHVVLEEQETADAEAADGDEGGQSDDSGEDVAGQVSVEQKGNLSHAEQNHGDRVVEAS